MTEDKTLLEYCSDIREFEDISKFMEDPDVTEAIGYIVKLSKKPNVGPAALPPMIVRLQALSAEFALQAKYYTIFSKVGDYNKRKHVYYNLSDSLDKLCNALKYGAKS